MKNVGFMKTVTECSDPTEKVGENGTRLCVSYCYIYNDEKGF